MSENKYTIMESVKQVEYPSYLETFNKVIQNRKVTSDKTQKMIEFYLAIADIEYAVEAKLKEVNNA